MLQIIFMTCGRDRLNKHVVVAEVGVLGSLLPFQSLVHKCRNFDDIFISGYGCTESCH